MIARLDYVLPAEADTFDCALAGAAWRAVARTVDAHVAGRLALPLSPAAAVELESLRDVFRASLEARRLSLVGR